MYYNGMCTPLGVKNYFKTKKYKKKFKNEHPLFFEPIGTMIFCGGQGKGKTLSAVQYVKKVKADFPCSILVSNVAITDYPFNTKYEVNNGVTTLIDIKSGNHISQEDIVQQVYTNISIEYDGLDCLKYVCNGEYGVLFLIDELHLELNSLESKNIDIDVMTEISQQRKQRKHIVGTSQVYMRLAKPLREQIFDVVLCNNLFKCLQWNKAIDGETAKEVDGKLDAEVRKVDIFFHSPEMYNSYDTFAKMHRYNKEWKGHKRDLTKGSES